MVKSERFINIDKKNIYLRNIDKRTISDTKTRNGTQVFRKAQKLQTSHVRRVGNKSNNCRPNVF